MFKLIKSLTLICILITNQLIAAESSVTIYTEELIPLSFKDPETAEIKGFSTEIIRQVMDDTGLDYSIEIIPWSRAYVNTLNNPNTILYSMTRTPEREDKFIWLQKILDLKFGIYTSDKSLIGSSIEDIKSLPITVKKNDLSHLILSKHGFNSFIFIHENERIAQLINRNRMNIFYTNSLWIKENKETISKKLYLLPNVELKNPSKGLYYVINPKTNPEILNKIRSSFDKFISEGHFDNIVKPYR